jgi:hypothetical protein
MHETLTGPAPAANHLPQHAHGPVDSRTVAGSKNGAVLAETEQLDHSRGVGGVLESDKGEFIGLPVVWCIPDSHGQMPLTYTSARVGHSLGHLATSGALRHLAMQEAPVASGDVPQPLTVYRLNDAGRKMLA